MENYKFVIGFD